LKPYRVIENNTDLKLIDFLIDAVSVSWKDSRIIDGRAADGVHAWSDPFGCPHMSDFRNHPLRNLTLRQNGIEKVMKLLSAYYEVTDEDKANDE